MPLVNQARKLVAQRNILGDEIRTISEYGGNNAENEWELERHRADHSLSRNHRKKSANSPPNTILMRHIRTRSARQHEGAVLGLGFCHADA